MSEEVQGQQADGSEEAALSIHDIVVAELAKLKEDATYVPALPKGIVLDAEMPDGYYMMRPCVEEYVAAGYPADSYNTYFSDVIVEGKMPWGPPWSNPNWTPAQSELWEYDALPAVLVVRSQVRRLGTRTTRARAPSRHRFKQFLFGDPSFRLVRNGERQVTTDKVRTNLDELIEKEAQGMLSVHFIDGRRLNLEMLKAGLVEVEAAPLPAPQADPPLDSAANDTPSGNPMPLYVEGTFTGDPDADATLERMLKDKASEQGDLPGNESDPLNDAGSEEDASDVVAEDGAEGSAAAEEPPADESNDSDPLLDSESDSAEDTQAPASEEVLKEDAAVVTEAPAVSTAHKHHQKSGKKGNKR